MPSPLDHDHVRYLREHHPLLRLLAAQNLPLIIGFLQRVFIAPGRRELRQAELESELGDYLYQLREREGEAIYPKPPAKYLDDWTRPELPFLRKYYPARGDEPAYDLTPATERAIELLDGLEQREFVGTESRLRAMFALLREIVQEGDETQAERLARLQTERAALDTQIERVRAGKLDTLDDTQVRERFLRLEDTVRRLLADFRQVEENFRGLDRATRERIATSESTRGMLLDEIFSEQDIIAESDEGRSFRAFWELLLNPAEQRDLRTLLERVLALPALERIERDPMLERLISRLTGAGEQVQRSLSRLNEQLRKFLDDRVWAQNRRIGELAGRIERLAVTLKDEPPAGTVAWLDDVKPELSSLMSRRLYTPPSETRLEDAAIAVGHAEGSVDALFTQSFVDLETLRANVTRLLAGREQITLSAVLEAEPPQEGLAEVIGYLELASRDERATIDDREDTPVSLRLTRGAVRRLRLPQAIFTR